MKPTHGARLSGTGFIILIGLIAFVAPSPARADNLELHADPAVELPVTLLAATVWLGGEGFKGTLASSSCRWCDRNADGSDGVNFVDADVRATLKWDDTDAGDTWSNVTAFGAAPVFAFGGLALAELGDDAIGRFPADALMVAEAVAFAGALNEVVKLSAGRERPFVHALPPGAKLATKDPSDNNTSFYSGHTSFTFALAAATGTVATLRGYRWAPAVWVAGMLVAAVTGYLRIAGDRHYFSDVLTGVVAGTAVGIAVPMLLHARVPVSTSASLSSAGPLLSMSGTF